MLDFIFILGFPSHIQNLTFHLKLLTENAVSLVTKYTFHKTLLVGKMSLELAQKCTLRFKSLGSVLFSFFFC